jgi:hypothetical protein
MSIVRFFISMPQVIAAISTDSSRLSLGLCRLVPLVNISLGRNTQQWILCTQCRIINDNEKKFYNSGL